MWSDIFQLFKALHSYEGSKAFHDVLRPVLLSLEPFAETFGHYKSLVTSPPGDGVPHEDLWTLYALSRFSDILLLGFQTRSIVTSESPGDKWLGPGVTYEDYVRFFCALGMELIQTSNFSPFFHEIIAVIEDASCNEVVIEEVVWPGLRFGHMVFARAGVCVRCSRKELDPNLAASTTLYFTFRRRGRATNDLSIGWGSNSQWRTAFRRDYAENGKLHYNADGRIMLLGPAVEPTEGDDLTLNERIELLTHRCFVRTAKPDIDRWPYNDRYAEPDLNPGR